MACRFIYQGKTYDQDGLVKALRRMSSEHAKTYVPTKLPDAPFIHGDKPYELALKKMIRTAAEEGKSRISWTPGEAQAARYDLSKHVGEIQFMKEPNGTYNTHAKTPDGRVISSGTLYQQPLDKIEATFGKEIASKIEQHGGAGKLEGLDLKVGGEGMKGFYDQMLPKMVEKLGKQYGVKVKEGSISGGADIRTPRQVYDILSEKDPRFKADHPTIKDFVDYWNDLPTQERDNIKNSAQKHVSSPVKYFDIPEKMKQDVLSKGFPLFSDTTHGATLAGLESKSWQKNPDIGWWKDQPNHYTMYHGTHQDNVPNIAQEGIKAPSSGPTAGKVSMAFDPYTAHGYASMGGESGFRAAGAKAQTIPHQDRRVLVAEIPKEWAHENMDQNMRGNISRTKENLKDRRKYEEHKKQNKLDHEYYATTELRFNKPIPKEFIKGVMQRTQNKRM